MQGDEKFNIIFYIITYVCIVLFVKNLIYAKYIAKLDPQLIQYS